jgi:hypothetical protein
MRCVFLSGLFPVDAAVGSRHCPRRVRTPAATASERSKNVGSFGAAHD